MAEPDPRRAVLVESGVFLAVVTDDPARCDWSARRLSALRAEACIVINPIIYAEVSTRLASMDLVEAVLPRDVFRREPLPWGTAFLAGRAFLAYRRAGGARRAPLPDVFIGAHAAVAGYRLLTRDAMRYRSYFPRLELVAP